MSKWREAIEKLREEKDGGVLSGFVGNELTKLHPENRQPVTDCEPKDNFVSFVSFVGSVQKFYSEPSIYLSDCQDTQQGGCQSVAKRNSLEEKTDSEMLPPKPTKLTKPLLTKNSVENGTVKTDKTRPRAKARTCEQCLHFLPDATWPLWVGDCSKGVKLNGKDKRNSAYLDGGNCVRFEKKGA